MNWNIGQYWEILMLQYLIKPWVYWFCEPLEKSKLNLLNSIGSGISVYSNWNIWVFTLFLSTLSTLLWDKILMVLVGNGEGSNFHKKAKTSFILTPKKNDELLPTIPTCLTENERTHGKLENSLMITHQNVYKDRLFHYSCCHRVLHGRVSQVKSFWLFHLLKTKCKKQPKSLQLQASMWNRQTVLEGFSFWKQHSCPEDA